MKKNIFFLIAMLPIAAIAGNMSSAQTDADEFVYNGIKYTVLSHAEQTVEVAASTKTAGEDGPTPYSGDIVIPSTVKNGQNKYTVIGIGQSAFVNCVGIRSLILPETLTYIEKEAFVCCLGLKRITIPKNVVSIGYDIFSSTLISEITVMNPVPAQVSHRAFHYPQNYNNCVLYVPYGTANAYRNASEWKYFNTIIEMAEMNDESGMIDGHEYVDLGLPSGTLWATMNYGATSEKEYGNYINWSSRSNVLWGDNWEIPKISDFKELCDHCVFTWLKIGDSIYGFNITGKNGKSIFLPAAGYIELITYSTQLSGGSVCYWSDTQKNSEFAYSLIGSEENGVFTTSSYNILYVALPIRFVSRKKNDNNIDGHEYVDLGLPSGKYWATTNYGGRSPEDYGSYLEWRDNSRISLDWGSKWTTPSLDDIRELENNCTWTWSSKNGHSGYIVTGNNGNSIFLPASGFMMVGQSTASKINEWVYYWTSTLSDSMADIILSTSSSVWYGQMNTSMTKLPIRPITKDSYSPTSINTDNKDNYGSESEWFRLDGTKTNKPVKGVNIVRMGDGRIKKILVK